MDQLTPSQPPKAKQPGEYTPREILASIELIQRFAPVLYPKEDPKAWLDKSFGQLTADLTSCMTEIQHLVHRTGIPEEDK